MTKTNVTRSTILSREEVSIIWKALSDGLEGRGNTVERLRKLTPILDAIENQSKELGDGAIEFVDDTNLDMTESQWAMIKTALDRSTGWNAASRKTVIPLADKLEELPLLKKEEKPEPEKESVPA